MFEDINSSSPVQNLKFCPYKIKSKIKMQMNLKNKRLYNMQQGWAIIIKDIMSQEETRAGSLHP